MRGDWHVPIIESMRMRMPSTRALVTRADRALATSVREQRVTVAAITGISVTALVLAILNGATGSLVSDLAAALGVAILAVGWSPLAISHAVVEVVSAHGGQPMRVRSRV